MLLLLLLANGGQYRTARRCINMYNNNSGSDADVFVVVDIHWIEYKFDTKLDWRRCCRRRRCNKQTPTGLLAFLARSQLRQWRCQPACRHGQTHGQSRRQTGANVYLSSHTFAACKSGREIPIAVAFRPPAKTVLSQSIVKFYCSASLMEVSG